MEKLAGHIIRFRLVVVLLVVAITLFLGYFMKNLRVNADVMGYLPEDDAAASLFREIGREYGGNEMMVIGISCRDVFDPEMLSVISQITDSVRVVGGIGHVTSLTNVIDIKGTDYGIEIGRLIDPYRIPDAPDALDSLKSYVLSRDMYRGVLVSRDDSATLVIAKVLQDADRTQAVAKIKEVLAGIPFDGELYYGGNPVILLELSSVILRDVLFIAPAAFLLISLVLFLGFRSRRGVLLPLLTVAIAIVWTMGLMGLLGVQITLLTNVIPVVLLAVGSAYTIHVINRFNMEWASSPKDALHLALSYVMVPVFLASLTTVLGFLSFIPGSYLTMIREFGIFTSLGIVFSFLLSIGFVPALLHTIKIQSGEKHQPKTSPADFLTAWIARLVFSRKQLVMSLWVILLLISITGIMRIERRVDLVDYFRKDNIVQVSEAMLKEKFNGSMPLYIRIKGDIRQAEALLLMQETQAFMQGYDYIPYSQSLADLIVQMNDVMGQGKCIPGDAAQIAQLCFLLEGQDIMEQLVRFDYSEGVVQGYVASTDLSVLREIETHFSAFAAEKSNENYHLEVTGIPIMFKRLDDSIIRSQVYSLVIAMALVILLISLIQGSVIRGLLSVIPIGVTLLVLFGTMGNTGIPLDIATVLTGSVTIGIGIDYAIHFMTHFSAIYRRGKDMEASIRDSMAHSGRGILINMLAVTIGFSVLLASNLVPLQRFGLLIAVTMVVSSLATLTLLPLVLMMGEKFFGKSFGIKHNEKQTDKS